MVVIVLVPPALVLLAAIVYLLPRWLADRRDMSDDNTARNRRLVERGVFYRLVVFALFLLYPVVSSTVLSFFVCRDVEGESYLVADFTVRCYDSRWYAFLPFALVMVAVYPVGVVLALASALHRSSTTLKQPWTRLVFGFLYSAYDQRLWWFEVVDMVYKLVLSSLIAFLEPRAMVAVGMGVVGLYLAVTLLFRPFAHKSDDRLHLLVHSELLVILTCVFVTQHYINSDGAGMSQATDVALSVILIALLAVVCVTLAAQSVRLARVLRNWNVRRGLVQNRGAEGRKRKETVMSSLTVNPLHESG